MADLQLILTIEESQVNDFKNGLLELYPNPGGQTDDNWFYSLPAQIVASQAKMGLKAAMIRLAEASGGSLTTPEVTVTLPDGTIING